MAKIDISRMNYDAMETFADTINECGSTIDTSIGAIDRAFRELAASNEFAGSTLRAVNDALAPVLKVRESIAVRAVNTMNAIKESLAAVQQAELQNEAHLQEILNIDPMAYEVPAEFNVEI